MKIGPHGTRSNTGPRGDPKEEQGVSPGRRGLGQVFQDECMVAQWAERRAALDGMMIRGPTAEGTPGGH